MSVRDEWGQFLGSKKRTARTHYSLGRKCSVCNRYITNNNKIGHCAACIEVAKRGESSAHKRLKDKAKEWFEEQGATQIKLEKTLKIKGMRVRADVYAILNGKQVIIECGGSQNRKLKKLLTQYKVLIWPYSFKKPYKYDPKHQVCNRCGNRIDCQV